MKSRKEIIYYILTQRAKGCENYPLNRFQRWFYTIKAIICLMFKLQKHFTIDDEYIDGIAAWGWKENYDEWTELAVGYGCFRNWKYGIYRNGIFERL